jgi:ribosomal protein S18 acetylase RimI-like enzyme
VGELELRESRDDDVEAMLAITQRAHRAVTGEAHPMTLERLTGMRSAPGRDPARDTRVVELDGRVVGYGSAFAQEPYSEIFTITVADPEVDDESFLGAHTLLVDAGQELGLRRTADLPRDPARVLAVSSTSGDARLAAAYASLGFTIDRRGLEMTIDLAGRDLPAPVWPDGMDARAVEVPGDLDDVSDVLSEAFRDHQGDLPFTPEFVRYVFEDDAGTRPEVSAIAFDVDGPVGTIVCRDRVDHGYVWVLAVLRRGRRRGLADALLKHAFREYAARGTTVVRLDVEESSLTGATRVYERAGMSVHSVHDTWTRPLHPA